jgi:hypothetical protein
MDTWPFCASAVAGPDGGARPAALGGKIVVRSADMRVTIEAT